MSEQVSRLYRRGAAASKIITLRPFKINFFMRLNDFFIQSNRNYVSYILESPLVYDD